MRVVTATFTYSVFYVSRFGAGGVKLACALRVIRHEGPTARRVFVHPDTQPVFERAPTRDVVQRAAPWPAVGQAVFADDFDVHVPPEPLHFAVAQVADRDGEPIAKGLHR